MLFAGQNSYHSKNFGLGIVSVSLTAILEVGAIIWETTAI